MTAYAMALGALALASFGCSAEEAVMNPNLDAAPSSIEQANQRLGRGINLGNFLEAPKEGEWGNVLEADFFRIIKEAGFSSVRLPCKWSVHAQAQAPYTLDPVFAKRVDWALDQASKNGLNLVLNVHHYDEFATDPDAHNERLIAIWRQIADRYKNSGSFLYFELFNEPHGKFDAPKWNAMIPRLLAEVRKTNPTRPVIVGPHNWNNVWALKDLRLPKDDNLIVTVHFYDPFEFTHQGAEWVNPAPKATRWTGTPEEKKRLSDVLNVAEEFGKVNKVPIYVGEFGAYSKGVPEDREKWTKFVVDEMNARGFSWAYWEFCAGFGAYDKEAKAWRKPLLNGLLGAR